MLFWGKQVARLVVCGLVAWGLWRTVASAQDKFAAENFDWRTLQSGWLIAAGALYLAGMLPSGLFWWQALRAMGQRPTLFETMRAFYVGHLGKYFPGKALVVVIRTALIRSQRVDTTVAAASVFVETLTMMAVGAVVAAVLLAKLFREYPTLLVLAIGLAVCAGVPTYPPLFRRLLRMLQVQRANPNIDQAIDGLGVKLMGFGWLAIAGGWLLIGLSLWGTLKSMPNVPVTLADLPLITATVSLAMVAGFLSLIPGGLGVREFVVMTLFVPAFGEVAAIVSALVLRLVWLVAELVAAAALYVAGAAQHAE